MQVKVLIKTSIWMIQMKINKKNSEEETKSN